MKKFFLIIALLLIAQLVTACGSNSGGVHTHSYTKNVIAATCTEKGSVTFTCSCGDSYTEEVKATGHSYSVTDNKAATCTENGYAKYVCVCGDSYTEEIKTTGHSYSAADSKAATCKENGYVKYACFCGDSYTEETRTSHIWQAATCTAPSTCEICGDTSGIANGHMWASPTCTAPKTCLVCNATEGDAKGHNVEIVPNDGKTHPLPTCTEDGFYLIYCFNCNSQWYEEGKAKGHTGGTATCVAKARCSRCNAEYGSCDKNNHQALRVGCNDNAYAATCEKEGYAGDKSYCSACDTTIEKGKTIPPLGHLLTPAPVYDKDTDKIKAYCQRQGCDGGEYTDIEPLRIELKGKNGPLNIYGGCYPKAKCYYIKADGTRREHELEGWPASQDLTWCGYYWLFSCTKWELGNKIEICAYDNSGRTATAIYEVVESDSGGYTFQKVG